MRGLHPGIKPLAGHSTYMTSYQSDEVEFGLVYVACPTTTLWWFSTAQDTHYTDVLNICEGFGVQSALQNPH